MKSNSILCTGLNLDSVIKLSETVELRPKRIEGDWVQLSDLALTQWDYGFLCSTHSLLKFELRIWNENSKNLTVDLWNHQWYLMYLSIVMRHPVYFNFQTIGDEEKIRVSNFMFGPRMDDELVVSLSATNRIKESYIEYSNFDQQEVSFAIMAAYHYHREPNYRIKLAYLWSGIESIFGIGGELKYRSSLTMAKIFGNSTEEKREIAQKFRKIYDIRSRCVHGGKLGKKDDIQGAVRDSYEYLCMLIEKISMREIFIEEIRRPDFVL